MRKALRTTGLTAIACLATVVGLVACDPGGAEDGAAREGAGTGDSIAAIQSSGGSDADAVEAGGEADSGEAAGEADSNEAAGEADSVEAAGEAPDEAGAPVTRPIEDVLADHTNAWMEMEGVEGTGIGRCEGEPCIKVYISRPPEDFTAILPERIDGYPVRLEPTGGFEAQ